MASAICFNYDQTKILSSANGLKIGSSWENILNFLPGNPSLILAHDMSLKECPWARLFWANLLTNEIPQRY